MRTDERTYVRMDTSECVCFFARSDGTLVSRRCPRWPWPAACMLVWVIQSRFGCVELPSWRGAAAAAAERWGQLPANGSGPARRALDGRGIVVSDLQLENTMNPSSRYAVPLRPHHSAQRPSGKARLFTTKSRHGHSDPRRLSLSTHALNRFFSSVSYTTSHAWSSVSSPSQCLVLTSDCA